MNFRAGANQSILHQGELPTVSIGYMPGLDGLRTLAVFAVIAYHLGLAWAPGGLLGVNLFFVLSGYLITSILFAQQESLGRINLKDFWLRRIRRLLPALFVMLAGVILWAVLFAPDRLAALKQEAAAAVLYVGNWYFIFREVSYFESFGPPSPLGHLWSLAIEEQFYLFWPLLLGLGFRFLPKRKWIVGGTVAIALVSAGAMALMYIPGADPSRIYYGTDTRAFALLIGAVPAMIWPVNKLSANISGAKKLSLDGAGVLALLALLWMILKTNQYQPFLYQGGLVIFSVAAAVLVVALAHPASRLSGFFGWAPMRWLGKWSYGIYLWHYPVILLSSPAVNTGGPDMLRSLWQIAVSVLLAALSYFLVEEPIRRGRMKPLILSVRVAVSALLIFAVMFVAAGEGMQISAEDLAGDLPAGGHGQVSEGSAEAPDDQIPPAEMLSPGEQVTSGEGETAKGNGGEVPSSGENAETEGIKGEISGDNITVITDSIMIDAAPVLQELLPGIVVDAKKGRQMYDAPEVISELRKGGKLGKTVIVGLGSNGAFTEKQLKATIDCLEGAEEIILLNTRVPKPWEGVVNETLTKAVESYPNVTLIDWYGISSGHDEYFYKDGVHLNRKGIDAYCKMIVESLPAPPEDQEEIWDEGTDTVR